MENDGYIQQNTLPWTLPIPFSLHPYHTSPEKVRNLRKFCNYIKRFYMQQGAHNAIHDMAKIKYLFERN